jgi:uncharacterized membrane protein YraQ (UPF0718 family)
VSAPPVRTPLTAGSPAPFRPVPLWVLGLGFWGVVIGVLALRATGVAEEPGPATFGLIFTSIVVETLPFIVLGAAVSAAVAVLVPDRAFAAIGRLPQGLQVPGAALAGFAFPVCECGSVPVARRLIMRGLHPAAGLAFMLASPILNPIVLASTWLAYDGQGRGVQMVLARAGLGLVVALAAAVAIGRTGADELLRARAGDHDHDHGGSGRGGAFVSHLVGDVLFMGKFVVLGAAVAAGLQTLLPRGVLLGVGGTPVLAELSLMALAFALALCSEADAFVAVSFAGFGLGPQLAFLVLGPVVDLKLAVLYGATFRRRFVWRLLLVAAPVALAGSLLLGPVLS